MEQYAARNSSDAQAYMSLGEGYFSRGDNKKYPQIEKYLRRTMELEPTWPFPFFFLGMYYFNCGFYEKSLSVLSQLDLSHFVKIGQQYRISEVLEVNLCSRLYLCPEEVSVDEFARLCAELFSVAEAWAAESEMDLALAAVPPVALARCVDSLFQHQELQQKARQMFDLLFDLLIKIGQVKLVARMVDRVGVRFAAQSSISAGRLESC